MTKETSKTHADFDRHHGSMSDRLNWLRAGVLGANDGIVSTAALLIGVAAAGSGNQALLTAGVAALVGGAMSMAVGEYVSVSTQRDTERAAVALEREELATLPRAELEELVGILRGKGLSEAVARQAAAEMTRHDALGAHADLELGVDPGNYANPWTAAASSAVAFSVGAALPLAAILLVPRQMAIPITVVAVLGALLLTGIVSARLGGAPVLRAALRNVCGGGLAMAVTWLVGHFSGVTA